MSSRMKTKQANRQARKFSSLSNRVKRKRVTGTANMQKPPLEQMRKIIAQLQAEGNNLRKQLNELRQQHA